MNRVQWDLMGEAPASAGNGGGRGRAPRAPLAAAGSYRVTLSVNGREYSSVVEVLELDEYIEALEEHPVCAWQALPFMVKDEEGFWRLPDGEESIPLVFTLKATKPAGQLSAG